MHAVNPVDFGVTGIKITYSTDGSTTVNGHIVKQIGPTKYLVAPGSIGHAYKGTYVKVRLAKTAAEVSTLPANVGTITVTVFGGGTEHARKIFGRKLLTVEGHTYFWRQTTAAHIGECNVNGDWVLTPNANGYYDKVNV